MIMLMKTARLKEMLPQSVILRENQYISGMPGGRGGRHTSQPTSCQLGKALTSPTSKGLSSVQRAGLEGPLPPASFMPLTKAPSSSAETQLHVQIVAAHTSQLLGPLTCSGTLESDWLRSLLPPPPHLPPPTSSHPSKQQRLCVFSLILRPKGDPASNFPAILETCFLLNS